MIVAEALGFLAGTLTTISFIPQVIQVVKTKSTRDISLGMFLAFAGGVLSWFFYGLMINSPSIIIANSITFILVCIILGYKFKYK